jgi:DNA-binding response OmpR family regulator
MLRPKEYMLAQALFQNLGRPLTRSFLHKAAWGGETGQMTSRAFDTHLARLRAKLKLVKNNRFEVRSVRDVGYRLDVVDKRLVRPVVGGKPVLLAE